MRILGGLFLALSVFLSISIYFSNSFDSSWSIISQDLPKNILGIYGSIVSDLMFVFFGKLTYIILLFLFLFSINALALYKKYFPETVFAFIAFLLFSIFVPKIGGYGFLVDETIKPYVWFGFIFSFTATFIGLIYNLIYIFNKKTNKTQLVTSSFYEIPKTKVKIKISPISHKENSPILNILIDKNDTQLPPRDLLKSSGFFVSAFSETTLSEMLSMFEEFGIFGDVKDVKEYSNFIFIEYILKDGIDSSRVINVSKDIAISLNINTLRVFCLNCPQSLGIEVIKNEKKIPYIRDILTTTTSEKIPLFLGVDIEDKIVLGDLSEIGSFGIIGNNLNEVSNFLTTIILSILFLKNSNQCQIVLMDFKGLDLDIPCALKIKEPSRSVSVFKWIDEEIEKRKNALFQLNTKTVDSFNKKLLNLDGRLIRKRIQTGFDSKTGLPSFEEKILDFTPFPLIVVIIHGYEYAIPKNIDLKEFGIFFICTTQKSSLSHLSYKACLSTNRTISISNLGTPSAEHLVGKGDMLLQTKNGNLKRIQTAITSEEDKKRVVDYLNLQISSDNIK